jgi:two-component system CheB/CheR fusion protein
MTIENEAAPNAAEFEAMLEYIREHRGFDFTGYKRSTLRRRIGKRMQDLGIDSYEAYLDELEVSASEFSQLFDTILINVSSFYRDAPVWQYVAAHLIPGLLARKQEGEPIRAWSAGCATGEEPYTVAMLLADALGEDEFRDRVKVFATDVDETALERARQAVYPSTQLESLPEPLRDRFLEGSGERISVSKELRRAVIFGRNDLVRDAPISRIDLLTCRNTLIYFNTDTQREVMARLHLALGTEGLLVLGKSEMLLAFSDGFTPENLSLRIFRKAPGVRLTPAGQIHPAIAAGIAKIAPVAPDMVLEAFRVSPIAQLVLDPEGRVVLGNEPLRELFNVNDADVGRPLKDLEISYRPVELRSLIDRAAAGDGPVNSDAVVWRARDGNERHLEVEVAALRNGSEQTGTSIAFLDVTRHALVATELETSKHELERAYEDLRSTVEELETTNKELQSTNEELETTNEELQSTNEELETMNEELQSSNEELETMNDELRMRTDELNQVNVLVESMLESLGLGVAVLDRELRVTMWNEHAKKLWGLDALEVRDQHFLNLDIGLPVQQLHDSLRAVITGPSNSEERVIDARDRRGRDIKCRIQCAPLRSPGARVTGVIVLMQTAELAEGSMT